MDPSTLFTREAAAGYDRLRLATATAVVVGCGAAGNNIVQTLALTGLGELRLIDPDVVEPSNLTRSPCFRPQRPGQKRQSFKARELAQAALQLSYAEDPCVRYAVAFAESLGLGAFAGAHVIISAVDRFATRGYLTDAARRLGIPLVTLGFSGTRGHVGVFPNRNAEEADLHCLTPMVEGGVSCREFARAARARGLVPATQPLAATFGALAAEAAIAAIHGGFPLGGKLLRLDVRTGRSSVVEITPNPDCPGVHRVLPEPVLLDVAASDPVSRLLEAAEGFAADPIVYLPAPFVIEAPCVHCGARVPLRRPRWAITKAPACRECPPEREADPVPPVTEVKVSLHDQLARTKCRRVGIAPGAIVTIEDGVTGALHTVQLSGEVDDLFVTKRRETRHTHAAGGMSHTEATEIADAFQPLETT
jgi:molybdopterin/thiamine biosynthesis adenylyltransferase